MPERIPQSVTIRVPLQAFLASDHVSPATGLVPVITISKNGGAYGNPSAGATVATEIANGSYYVDLSTTDTGTVGPLFVRGAVATMDPITAIYNVVAFVEQTGDTYARLGAPAGASHAADVAAVKTDTAAVKLQTDKLAFTVTNQVDCNVLDWKSATAPAMTGDAFARLGAAGAGLTALGDTRIANLDAAVSTRSTFAGGAVASVTGNVGGSVASVVGAVGSVTGMTASDVGAIKAKTDNLPASPASTTNITAASGVALTAAYDAAKTAASQSSVNAIPTTPLLAADYTAPDNANIASNNAGISAIYNHIGVPSDWGSGSTLAGNFNDANAWLNVIMAVSIDGTYGNAALKSLIDALPAATRDVSNSSPAAGSWGEASRNADAKAADIQITLGTPADTVSADIAAIADATSAIGIRTAVGLSNPDLDTQLAAKPSLVDILRTAMTEGYAMAGSAPTLEQFLFMIEAQLRSRVLTGTAPAVLTSHKLDGTTDAMTFSVDDTTSPTTQERVS